MSEIHIRQATHACSAAGPNVVFVAHEVAHEPSHIHIPRPSRISRPAQAASPERKQPEAGALPRILAEEAAA